MMPVAGTVDTSSYSIPAIATWAGTTAGTVSLTQDLGRVQTIAHEQVEDTAGAEPAPEGADGGPGDW